MAPAATVDEHLAALPAARRAWMQQLRETIRAAAPDAVEVITYGMPGFKSDGSYLVSYEAFKRHYSLFAGGAVIDAFRDEVEPYVQAKSTIAFPIGMPVPVELVTKIIRYRLAAIADDRRA
jgi:uncharacterized protein YdhG (YjbR/CyaY superfamily)